jgi:phage terminase large subunit-like protein
MEQSFANENITSGNNEIIKVCVNDVILEEKSKGNPSVQTKTRRNPKN